ncbi:hypothetical protein [Streptomyces chartreusis]
MAIAYTERDGRSWRCDGCGSHGRVVSQTDGHRMAAETVALHIEDCTPTPATEQQPERTQGPTQSLAEAADGSLDRPISELRDSGLLWLINRTVFHPRGLALALAFGEAGEVTGWRLIGDGSEPMWFSPDDEPRLFAAAQATLAAAQRGE